MKFSLRSEFCTHIPNATVQGYMLTDLHLIMTCGPLLFFPHPKVLQLGVSHPQNLASSSLESSIYTIPAAASPVLANFYFWFTFSVSNATSDLLLTEFSIKLDHLTTGLLVHVPPLPATQFQGSPSFPPSSSILSKPINDHFPAQSGLPHSQTSTLYISRSCPQIPSLQSFLDPNGANTPQSFHFLNSFPQAPLFCMSPLAILRFRGLHFNHSLVFAVTPPSAP